MIKEDMKKLIHKKEKLESTGLKKSINFYQKVFKIDKKNCNELLQFSSKGKVFDIIKVQENLTKLITLRRSTQEHKYQPSELVGKGTPI